MPSVYRDFAHNNRVLLQRPLPLHDAEKNDPKLTKKLTIKQKIDDSALARKKIDDKKLTIAQTALRTMLAVRFASRGVLVFAPPGRNLI